MIKKRVVHVVGDYRNEIAGYMKLAEFAAELFADRTRAVTIDCHKLNWFSGSLGAILGALVWRYQLETDQRIIYENLSPHLRKYFGKLRLISSEESDTWGTVVALRRFSINQHKEFSKYTEESFVGKGLPQMTPALQEKFYESLDEIYGNASFWSQTAHGVCVAGQFFPRENHMDFSICDMGRGFRQALFKDKGIDLLDCEAIEWATQEKNTTRVGHVPGGIGLKIIREFIELNRGKLRIISHNGYWEFNGGNTYKRQMPSAIPGTIVNLVIDTSDTKSYDLAQQVHPGDIF